MGYNVLFLTVHSDYTIIIFLGGVVLLVAIFAFIMFLHEIRRADRAKELEGIFRRNRTYYGMPFYTENDIFVVHPDTILRKERGDPNLN